MKKALALLLALALTLSLAACGGKPESAARDTAEALPAEDTARAEPAITQVVGYYETDPDEYGNVYALDYFPDGTGIYSLMDGEYQVLDDMPFDWTDTNLYLYGDRENGQLYELEGETVTVHFRWFEDEDAMVFHRVELPPEVGCYSHIYEEGFEGETFVFEYFVELYRNHTGTIYMQDVMPILWEDGVIKYEDGTEAYRYTLDEEGVLHLHREYTDFVYDEDFYPRDYGPGSDSQPGAEFTLGDLERSWSLAYYAVEGGDAIHFADEENVFCYLDRQVDEAGQPCFCFHWENEGGYIDVPCLYYDFREGMLTEGSYNQVWYVNLHGTGTIKDRHREERPYQVAGDREEGTETEWYRMYAELIEYNTIRVRLESYVDGLDAPVITDMFMVEAMG